MATPPPLPDPARLAKLADAISNLGNETEKTVERKIVPPLKGLGGRYARYNKDLVEHTEAIIYATMKIGMLSPELREKANQISANSQRILEQTMTYMDRSASRTNQILKKSLDDKSNFEKQIESIDRDINNAKSQYEKTRLEAQREELVKSMTREEASFADMRKAQQQFLKARTDRERESAQDSGKAVIRANKESLAENLKDLKAAARKEQSLQIEIAKTTDRVLKQKLTDELALIKKNSDFLLKREKDLESSIKNNTKLQEETLGAYKAGVKGFAGELMSKTFTGGLVGAIFKGQGFADLIPNLSMMLVEKSGILDMMGGGMAGFLFGGDSEQGQRASAMGAKTAEAVAIEGGRAMISLFEEATTPGSIYTHDIHSEKILMDIYEYLTGNKAESAGAAKPKDAAPKGGKIGKIKGTLSGIGAFLQSIAQGIASFGDRGVFKGALGLAAVGAAMIPFAFGMSIMTSLPVAGLLASTLAIVAIGTAAIFLGKFSGDVLMGALTLGLLGLALIPMGFAFSVLGNINVGSIFAAILAISAIGVLAFTLGLLVAGPQGLILLAGIGMLALLGVALIPLALSLMLIGMVDGSKLITLGLGLLALVPALALMAMVSPLLPLVGFGLFMIAAAIFPLALAASMINPESVTSLNSLFTTLATSAPMMLMAAFGIAAISMALVTFATAVGIATGMLALVAVASVIGSFFGMGKINVLDQIFGLAQISGKLMQTANALNMIATAMQTLASALSTMGDSTSALETLDTIMSLDATQMQTLQDVSMAMDKISSANKQLTGENQAGKIGDAAGSGAGLAVVTNSSNSSNSTAIIGSPTGRSTDPSILFSSERYYSMIYR